MEVAYGTAAHSCAGVHGLATGTSPPVLVGGGCFALLVYPQVVRGGKGRLVYAPTHVGRFECATGALVTLSPHPPVPPGAGPGGALGTHSRPRGVSAQQRADERDELLRLYDLHRPDFEAGAAGDAAACARTLALYDSLAPRALRPFLDPVGAAFLGWLRQHAR